MMSLLLNAIPLNGSVLFLPLRPVMARALAPSMRQSTSTFLVGSVLRASNAVTPCPRLRTWTWLVTYAGRGLALVAMELAQLWESSAAQVPCVVLVPLLLPSMSVPTKLFRAWHLESGEVLGSPLR